MENNVERKNQTKFKLNLITIFFIFNLIEYQIEFHANPLSYKIK
jgi:hypothetical protein